MEKYQATYRHNKLSLYLGFFIFIFLFFLGLGASLKLQAATWELAGKADWGNYGYIYFHCSEAHTGNLLDEVENLEGAGRFLPPAEQAFHFTGLPCEFVYGVKIEEGTGILSGSAWNNSLGEVYFERQAGDGAPPNYSFNSNCPEPSACSASTNCLACYNFDTQKIYGWAYIKYEKSGTIYTDWISLDSEELSVYLPIDDEGQHYGYDLDPGDVGGQAKVQKQASSYDYSNIINFHCLTKNYPNVPDNPYCSDFKVYVKDLILTNLSAPHWGQDQACRSEALQATLRWNSFGVSQLGYEIVVGTQDNFENSKSNPVCHVNKPSIVNGDEVLSLNGSTNYYNITRSSNANCPQGLSYNTAYYWWIRAYYDTKTSDLDENGQVISITTTTDWIQYSNNSNHDTDKNLDGNPKTFQTFKHQMPKPIIAYHEEPVFDDPGGEDDPEGEVPEPIQTNTTTIFTSYSKYYTPSSPDTNIKDCSGSSCNYFWSTDDPDDILTDQYGQESNSSNPIHIIFDWAGNKTVTFKVSDPSDYTCTYKVNLKLDWDLPIWKEVKPN